MSNKNETNNEAENCKYFYYRVIGTIAFAVGVTYLFCFESSFPQGVLGKTPQQYLDYTE